ncbi:hypothetical protein [Roseisolibacter sp. H3M3-2]|uniref:hypothetical protein n=1 Tax=Roseisolibacter sp. H3M3-2 TaxID=3031323 RepID=UPI0023DC8EC4|nr:hypothetical protein [Roseisolibacter sp. H3M3-2]MDF1502799.1 hypothetical protein [Roseisolibacter sp. H3M3-2]
MPTPFSAPAVQPPPPPVPGVPAPPPPPGLPSEAASDLARELQQVQEQVDQAVREATAGQARAGVQAQPFGVTKQPDGRIRIVARNGEVTELDPTLFRPDQIQELVETALEPPDVPEPDRGPPESVIQLVGIVMFFLAAMVVLGPLMRAWARRLDKRGAPAPVPHDVAQRLDRIEQAVESVAVEMERVSEAQRFSARLLSERLPDALPAIDAAAQRARVQG